MFYKLSNNLFHWRKFNPDILLTIAFLTISTICILTWVNLFDNKPRVVMNKKGVFIRKSVLPFSSLKLIVWENINHIELDSKRNKNITSTYLDIYRKDFSKIKRIDLDILEYAIDDILEVIRKYSKLINYRDRTKIKN